MIFWVLALKETEDHQGLEQPVG
ncbi:rCG49750 [Rattus norvegicus]|uniref:RCG49750 n=1 Tax=Rattus norvegicus TaxID=10116 RepID=A6K4M8_RAT|nr:rCG49750 [Rattus norvegicus]